MALPPPPPRPPSPPAQLHPDLIHSSYERNEYDHLLSRWGIGDALASMAVFMLVSVVVGLVAIAQSSGTGFDGFWLPLAITSPAAVLLAHITWVGRARGRGVRLDFQFRFKPVDLGIGAGLCISGLILAAITAAIIVLISGEEPTAAVAELAEDSGDGSGLTIWIYLLAVLGATLIPVAEELLFRGVWWSALEKRGMHPVAILALTSAIFALFHLEPIRTPVLFVLGMAIGLGRLVTGRIGASIVAHMFVNGIAMLFLLIELS